MIKSKGYDGKLWVLVHASSGEAVNEGTPLLGGPADDEPHNLLGGTAPHKSDSSGRIEVGIEGVWCSQYFPGVYNFKWVPEAQFIAAAMGGLLDVIRSGPPEVIGYDHGGPAQKAFDHGWSAASDRIYQAFIIAQRAMA